MPQNTIFFQSLKNVEGLWKHFEQASQWFETTALREEYIFSVCAVGNLFTGSAAHSEHMLLHVQSASEPQEDWSVKAGAEKVFLWRRWGGVCVCTHVCLWFCLENLANNQQNHTRILCVCVCVVQYMSLLSPDLSSLSGNQHSLLV